MFCTECGTKNEDNSNFCYECGHPKEQGSSNGSQTTVLEKEQKEEKKSSKSNSKIFRVGIIAIVIVALLGTTVFGAKDFIIRKFVLNDPVKRISYGYKKMLDAKTLDTTSKISLEFTEYPDNPEIKVMYNLLNDFSVLANSKFDNNADKFLQTIDFRLDDNSMINASIYGDNEVFALDLPSLLEGWIYVELKELPNILEEMDIIDRDSRDFNFEDYEQLLDMSNIENWEEIQNDYIDFMSEELGKYIKETGSKVDVIIINNDKESTIKCEEIVVKMDFKDMIDFIEDLFSEIEDDDRIKDLLTLKIQQFYDIAIENGDIDEMGAEEDDVEDIMDRFDDFYDGLFEEMEYSFDMLKDEMEYNESSFEYTWSFRLDSGNNLRGISCIAKIESTYYDYYEGYIDLNFNIQSEYVVNSINKGLDFEKPNLKKGYNFSDDPEEALYDIEEDMQKNFEKLIESKKFEPIMELLQTINPYYFY